MRLLQDRQDRQVRQGARLGRFGLGALSAASLAIAVAVLAAPALADPAAPAKPGAPAATGAPPVKLAALVPADDARACIALGPAGQIYAPDGHGAWVRRHAGGIASEIATVARAGQAVIVGTQTAAYRLIASAPERTPAAASPPASPTPGAPSAKNATPGAISPGDTWSVIYLGQHAKPITSFGVRALAAVGRQLFALDRAAPMHVADAATAILAIGASPTGVVVLTDHGLFRLAGKVFEPIARAPQQIARLVSDRWALVDRGAVDLKSGATIAWPNGFTVAVAAAAADDALVACGATTDGFELVTVRNGKLDRERVPLDRISAPPRGAARPGEAGAFDRTSAPLRDAARPGEAGASDRMSAPTATATGIVADRAGRIVIALTDGRLAIRDAGAWTTTAVRDELSAPRPGSPPATSR